MTDDTRVQHLLAELLDSRLAPEEVCAGEPELLPIVRERWQRMRSLEAEVEALFPTPAHGRRSDGTPRPPAELPRIPGYGLESVLGRGGMGVVYKALHLRLGRHVALKMLLAGEFAAAEQLARFAREAEVVAGLCHPNIVKVFDVGDHDGRPWFTMELIEGGSLAQRLAGGPQPARAAASMVVTLAEAMEAAHAGGVVHRDLKPANILMAADGTLKISDFGLARRLHGGGSELTLSGATLGTPSYMAPEQALGKERLIGPAVDVYALGALLYELLTGRPPFRGETAAETERMVIHDDPVRPSHLNAKVPRDLETILLKCLQKDPARRYGTAAALADDLHRFLRDEPITARPVGASERALKWMRRRPAQASAVAGAALLAAVVLSALLWLSMQRASTERAASDDLNDMARREQAGDWVGAATALERVRTRLGDGGSAALRARVADGQRDLELVAQLDDIRLRRAAVRDGRFDPGTNRKLADASYEAAFREGGWGVVGDDPQATGARIAMSGIRDALVAALDDWAVCLPRRDDEERLDWLLDVARFADPDPTGWRNRVRDRSTWKDAAALSELARTALEAGSSLPCLVALAEHLNQADGDGTALLKRLQQEHPGDFWANLTLGDALRERHPGEAIRYYQAALSIRPDAAVASNNLGIALALDGQPEEAVTQFRKALRLDPAFAHAQFNLGNGLAEAGRRSEAIDAYRRGIELEPKAAELHANLAKALGEDGRVDEALREARLAVSLDDGHAKAHLGLGYLLMVVGLPREAVAEDRRAIELDDTLPEAHVNLGYALIALGQLDEAIDECSRGVELDPKCAEAYSGLGNALRAKGQVDEAIEQGRIAVQLEPENARYHNGLANSLAMAGRYDESIAHFTESTRLSPGVATTHANLGNMLGLMGQLDEAIVQFQEALRLDPELAQANGSLGQALLNSGRLEEARPALARGLELCPEGTPMRAECVRQLSSCDALLALQQRMPAFLDGSEAPADAAEGVLLATWCRLKQRYALAARFGAQVMASWPETAADERTGLRYLSACAAVQAAAGKGSDAADLTAAERTQLRGEALEWLTDELVSCTEKLESGAAGSGRVVQRSVGRWLSDQSVAAVRDETALASFPPDEKAAWQALWNDVAALARRAQAGP